LGYYDGLEWSYITLEYCPQHYSHNGTWLGFGQRCMSLLSLVFLRGFRDAQSERRLSICLEFLSLTSSTFVRAFRLCGNWHIWDFVAALVLCCALALCFYVSILHLCRLPGYGAPFLSGPIMASKLKQFVQRFLFRDLWFPVSVLVKGPSSLDYELGRFCFCLFTKA
jgi:hypothetical protein